MDTSTPWMEGEQKTKYDPESAKWAMKLPDVDDKTNEQYLSIAKKINGNKSQRDEDERLGDNLGKLKNVKFPKGMPTKYFLADQSVEGIKLRQADFKGLKNWDQQHIDVLINFTNAIAKGEQLIAPGAEGIKAVEIANSMFLSDWLGHSVTLPVDDDLFYEKLQEKVKEEKENK